MSDAPQDDGRVDQILQVLLAYSKQDFKQRATVSDKLDEVDALATGLNMLAEELHDAVASKRELEAAYCALKKTQAKLMHSGKLIAIGQVASGVAHEINNPASWVALSVTLLSDRLENARALVADRGLSEDALRKGLAKALDEMSQAAAHAAEGMERIRAVAGDLRTFSRTDGDLLESVSLNDVVDAACRFTAPSLRPAARVSVQLAPARPTVDGNRGRLAQVVTNLLINAAQAIALEGSSGDQISVRTAVEGIHALLVVEDSGPGVPHQLREQIFEPFFTTKSPSEGTGLGLSLVADIVHGHGGTVQVSSPSSGGARFEVRLPLGAGAMVSEKRSPEPAIAARPPRARVLIIDDEVTLLRTYEILLKTEHEVTTVPSGAAALELLERDQSFDIVLCDLQMPGIDGLQLFQRATAKNPALSERFVFCTGGGVQPHIRQFIATTTMPILEKPVRVEVLLAMLARMAHGRRNAPTSDPR